MEFRNSKTWVRRYDLVSDPNIENALHSQNVSPNCCFLVSLYERHVVGVLAWCFGRARAALTKKQNCGSVILTKICLDVNTCETMWAVVQYHRPIADTVIHV